MINKVKNFHLKPTQILVLGFLGIIVLGTILLSLPIASAPGKERLDLVDSLFTATSAVCVTGLVVANSMEQWSVFGKMVILVLIQIGGLGIMTMATTLFMLLGKKIGLKERLLIQEALNQNAISGMVRLVRNILFGTLLIEGIGALILTIRFLFEFPLHQAFGYGVFHSVSAFCNAGFDILSLNSLSPYAKDWTVNLVVMLLIILGGLGFTVWVDLVKVTREKLKHKFDLKHWFLKLSLHTKMVLVLTVSLLVLGFIFFYLLEMNNVNTIGEYKISQKVLAALFQSTTPRTAGFNTMPLNNMTDGSKFLTIILMFIGGSPGGTAGGVKTVTMGVLFFAVVSVVRSKPDTEVYDKRIPEDLIKRALAVILISFAVVTVVTILLTVTEHFGFLDILFESVSAFGTVGLTLGITSGLTTIGKIIISMTMFIGRLGPMTMAVAFAINNSKRKAPVRKPEEKIMVG